MTIYTLEASGYESHHSATLVHREARDFDRDVKHVIDAAVKRSIEPKVGIPEQPIEHRVTPAGLIDDIATLLVRDLGYEVPEEHRVHPPGMESDMPYREHNAEALAEFVGADNSAAILRHNQGAEQDIEKLLFGDDAVETP